ncbi:novel acetylcholine receptor chaperone-like [Oppia nitens]|uniref:novel acetylcholine receptor chaperone-like n=1 Tax=Oppia nitens TaxID=1686743 RepID=UPI0023DA6BDA|nr:novel acetylcholine receptor chaperone-like [Oppia nitens]
MGSIVLTTLSVFLGMFFVFMGSIKVSQQVNREMHREIRRQFVQYAKVLPLAAQLGFKVSPKYYRLVIGWTELVAGLTLAFIPGKLKLVSNVLLVGITFGGIYTHVMIGDRFERIAPSIVFTLMLCCRLIVSYQVKRREVNEELNIKKLKTQSQPQSVSEENKKEK